MPIISEGPRVADFMLSESNGYRSRAGVTIAASQNLKSGQILAASGGNYSAAAADGTAAGICYGPVTTGSGETVKATAILRDAEVRGSSLVFASGITAPQKAAQIATLATLGIIVR